MDVGEWQAAELMPRADIAVTGSPALSDALSLSLRCISAVSSALSAVGHNRRRNRFTRFEQFEFTSGPHLQNISRQSHNFLNR